MFAVLAAGRECEATHDADRLQRSVAASGSARWFHAHFLRCLRFLKLVSACVLRGNKTGVGELQKPDGGVPVVEIGGRLFVVRETKTPTVENPEQ